MLSPSVDQPKLTSEHEKVLQSLVINEHSPGTIIHDFNALLEMLKTSSLSITASAQLTMSGVSDVNKHLAHPLQLGLKRPQQKSYPPVHGLYLLVRASGLTYAGGTEKKPLLLLDEVIYQQWVKLNPTERYFTLLETWLLQGKPEILGESRRIFEIVPENYRDAASFYFEIPGNGRIVAGNRNTEEWLIYRPGWHNLGLLHLFGLVHIEEGPLESGKGWHIKTIYRTALGDALFTALYSGFFKNIDNILRLENEGKAPFGTLQPVFQPYFPEWKNNLSIPEWAFRDGTYTFKISLGRIWRRITIDGKQTLDALALIILDSVDFDQDHLYEFSYKNRFGWMKSITHPYMEEGPYTSEVLVGEVPIRIGQAMTYLFDFGDQWTFDVTLEQVDSGKIIKKPRILEKHWESPEQYPSWDE